jgi:hypothetical protein
MPDLTAVPAASQDRRTFLKAAVVASAAVAAAGGAAGAALLSGGKPSPLIKFVGGENSGDPCEACIEGTIPNPTQRNYLTTNMPATQAQLDALKLLAAGFTVNSSGHAAGDFQVFVVDHAPAAATGSAKINLVVTVTGTAVGASDSGTDLDSSNLFDFVGGGSSVVVTEQTNVNMPPCPTDHGVNLATWVKTLGQGASLSGVGLGTAGGIHFSPVNSGDDVLVDFHFKWDGNTGRLISNTTGAEQLYTFQFTWTDNGTGGTSCTKYLYIYGQQT